MNRFVSHIKAWLNSDAKRNITSKKEKQRQQLVFNMRDCTDVEVAQLTTIVTNAMVREGRLQDIAKRSKLHKELKPDETMLTIESLDPFRTNSPFYDIHSAIQRNPLYYPAQTTD
jgi:hypothetical protein